MKVGKIIVFAVAFASSVPAAAEPNVNPDVAERVTNNADLVRFRTEASADAHRADKPCKPAKRAKKERPLEKPNGG